MIAAATLIQDRQDLHNLRQYTCSCGVVTTTAARARYKCSGCGKRNRIREPIPFEDATHITDYTQALDILREHGPLPASKVSVLLYGEQHGIRRKLDLRKTKRRLRMAELVGLVKELPDNTWQIQDPPGPAQQGKNPIVVRTCHHCHHQTPTTAKTEWTCHHCRSVIRVSATERVARGEYRYDKDPLFSGDPEKPALRILRYLFEHGQSNAEDIGKATHRPKYPEAWAAFRSNQQRYHSRRWAIRTLNAMQRKGWVKNVRPGDEWIAIIDPSQVMT